MKKLLVYLVPIATLVTIIVNGLSGTGKINNLTPQALSDSYPVMFVPAGYVFSIWGLIYVGIILYSYYQLKHQDEEDITQTRALYIVSCLANISWIFLWHYRHPIWSVLAMVVLLVSLITVYLKLGIGKKKVSKMRYLMVNIPFGIYLGWISVATIANVSVALYVLKWDAFGFSVESWTTIMVIVATVLGELMLFRRKDYFFALVIIWAIIGISYKFPEAYILWFTVLISVFTLGICSLGVKGGFKDLIEQAIYGPSYPNSK